MIDMANSKHGVSPKKPRSRPQKTAKRLAIKKAAKDARTKKK